MELTLQTSVIRGLSTAWLTNPRQDNLPTIVFLHGFPDSPHCWSYQTEHFGETFNIVAPFSRGVPPSEAPSTVERYNADSTILDLIKILEPYRGGPLFLVGHDLGCIHASQLAELLGKRVAGVVLINGMDIKQFAKRLRNPRQAIRSWYMYLMQIPLVPEFAAKRYGRQLQLMAYRKGGLSPERQPEADQVEGAITGPLNYYRAFLRSAISEVTRHHKRLKCPVLVLFGDQDPFLVAPTRNEFDHVGDDITIRILHGSHWMHRQQPELINGILEQFFKQNLEDRHE